MLSMSLQNYQITLSTKLHLPKDLQPSELGPACVYKLPYIYFLRLSSEQVFQKDFINNTASHFIHKINNKQLLILGLDGLVTVWSFWIWSSQTDGRQTKQDGELASPEEWYTWCLYSGKGGGMSVRRKASTHFSFKWCPKMTDIELCLSMLFLRSNLLEITASQNL